MSRTPAEIEHEIEQERAALAANLEGLQDNLSVEAYMKMMTERIRDNTGEIGRAIVEQAKANPVPLALTGIGLAWMMFSERKRPVNTYSAEVEDRPYAPIAARDTDRPEYQTVAADAAANRLEARDTGAPNRPKGFRRVPVYDTAPDWSR